MSNELAQMQKLRRFLVALTVLNVTCVLLVFLGAPLRSAWADSDGILRGRGLQIVDQQDRIRAAIAVLPADPKVRMPDGGTLPDTVILRLIDPQGRPEVKLVANEQGAGFLVMGQDDKTFVRMKGLGSQSAIEMSDKAGHQKTLEP
ncbi:MAG TPA: hypothetical protein VHE12_00355 [bacterium]|nr:hypothetical protein [bacterium]